MANIFKQILGTRYLMAPGLWHRTWYGSTSDRMPLHFNVCACDCVCVYAWARMCVLLAKVKPRTDALVYWTQGSFEQLLSQQIKAGYSFPCCQ